MNIIIALIIAGILIALGTAFVAMTKGGKANSEKMLKSLSIRVGLSLFLFMFLLLANYMGWVTQNGV